MIVAIFFKIVIDVVPCWGWCKLNTTFLFDSLDVTHQIYMFDIFTLLNMTNIEKKLNGFETYETPFSIGGLCINSFDKILRVWG